MSTAGLTIRDSQHRSRCQLCSAYSHRQRDPGDAISPNGSHGGFVLVLAMSESAYAYVGPGAGFALASSFLAVFAAVFSAFVMFLTWPIRLLFRSFFGKKSTGQSQIQTNCHPWTGWSGSRLDNLAAGGRQAPESRQASR